MTTRDNGGPGKTRHLNDIAASCEALGMRVIGVNAAERDFWLSASQQCATALDGKTRIFLAKSDVSQLRELCKGEDGEKLAEAIHQNCSVWFPLNPGGNGNDA
ncbi:hypothetical protein QDX92_004307 [Salmonella enterica]|nr:hypothetical protein [Salmonella enterica subsp. enterica serovar Sandiego]ECJ6125883.1 hypothetical protein [Salmonella enterica]EAA3659902.1 hypothetical protein [Salmonella enterica subsp. enterica serovar Sandiego]EEE4266538.1 hypothetical protein [Salmonella enterica subsp. enterica serovar Sandiego]EJE9657781.1 hypothetical protein [Salmonella enterica]